MEGSKRDRAAAEDASAFAAPLPARDSAWAADAGSSSADDPHVPAMVLLVDDDPLYRSGLHRLLHGAGYVVTEAADAQAALEQIDACPFDLILTDVNMPGLDGLELLRRVRDRDALASVVLITGQPSAPSAASAAALGAMHYLIKPVDGAQMLAIARRATRLTRLARLQRWGGQLVSGQAPSGEPTRLGRDAQLAKALSTLWLAHQPIVGAESGDVVGHEVLMRFDDPTLKGPPGLLELAEACGRLPAVGRLVRQHAARSPALAASDRLLFVNLHATDLADESLRSRTAPLTKIASQVVLEITERARLENVEGVAEILAELRSLGFRLAVDDLGAGYSGLSSLTLLEPEFIKIDMSLVRDIDSIPAKRRIVSSLVALARELGMIVVSEGVETAAERQVLADLGSHLLQGYLLGRPSREPTAP